MTTGDADGTVPAAGVGSASDERSRAHGERDSRPHPMADSPPVARPSVPHASPKVRRYARELGVELTQVPGSGPQQRILIDDVKAYVQLALAGESGRVPRAAGGACARLFADVDITELDAYCTHLRPWAERHGVTLSGFPFVVKAAAGAWTKRSPAAGSGAVEGFPCAIRCRIPARHADGEIADVSGMGIVELVRALDALAAAGAPGRDRANRLEVVEFGDSGDAAAAFDPEPPAVACLTVAAPRPAAGDGAQALSLALGFAWDPAHVDAAAAAGFLAELTSMLADVRRILE